LNCYPGHATAVGPLALLLKDALDKASIRAQPDSTRAKRLSRKNLVGFVDLVGLVYHVDFVDLVGLVYLVHLVYLACFGCFEKLNKLPPSPIEQPFNRASFIALFCLKAMNINNL